MRTRGILTFVLVLLLAVPVALAGNSKDEIRTRMKERYPTLKEMKKEQKVGETNLGFVEAVTEKLAKDKKIAELVSSENADRKLLYELIAKETKTTPEVVGKNNAMRIFKKAGDDAYFKGEDDKWRLKKDVKVEKKT